METLEQIAKKLHGEARKVWPNLTGLHLHHKHAFERCGHKQWFMQMATAFLPLLQAKQDAEKQLEQARGLIAIIVAAYAALGRWQRVVLEQRDNQTALAQDAAADLQQAVEAAASAGCVLERNQHGNWIGRNKLVAGKPTRIIKLPNVNFYTMKITHVDGRPIGPISVVPAPLLRPAASVPDATGDDRTYHGGSSDPMGD